jgi:putative flippase GtrA
MAPGWANVVATGLGTIPSFELNRRWVWGKSGQRSLVAEIGPFWVLSFVGLGLSTLAVSVADGLVARAELGMTARTLAAAAANLGTFGSLWVVQYLLLDRVLFRQPVAA